MKLKGAVIGASFPLLPTGLKNRIALTATCALSQKESEIFSVAFQCLSLYLNRNGDPYPDSFVSVVFTDQDSVTMVVESRNAGNYMPLIIYPLHKFRALHFPDFTILTVALEELCHCFFMENDEEKVKYIVLDVARCKYPELRLNDLYVL